MLQLLLPLVLGTMAGAQISGSRITTEPPLSPAQVAELESSVHSNPDDTTTRLRLLRHYTAFLPSSHPTSLGHILYLIEHLPSDPNASIPLTYIAYMHAPGHAQLRQAWMGALQRFPGDDRVLKNAVRFLYREHPQEAEQLLRQAVDGDPANRTLAANLGFLYALHILGIASPYPSATRPQELHQQLRESALQELERTSNPYVLTGAGTALPNLFPHTQAALGQPTKEPFELAAKLRQRARELAGPADTDLHGPMPLIQEFQEFQRADMTSVAQPRPATPYNLDPPEPASIVDRLEQEAKLIEKRDPVYPELAQKARIQGTVLFQLLIDKEGRVENATLRSGHPLLVPAATEAIRGYRYQPTIRDGQPVKVRADVGVPFVLR